MTQITKKLTVDLARQSNARALFATQNDKDSRTLEITLTDDGKPYVLPSDSRAVLNCVRPDKACATFLANVKEGGVVTVTLGLWALSLAGEVICSVTVFDGSEKRLTSSTFVIEVAETLCDDNAQSDPRAESLLAQLVASSINADESEISRRNAENQRAEAENARTLAENSREASEALRVSEETLRQAHEQTRSDSEAARQSTENKREIAEQERYRNEQLRVAAEELRESAERERELNFESALSEFSESSETALSDFSASGEGAISELEAETERARKMTDSIDSRLTASEKRIKNLEMGISPDPFFSDESSAYERIVPEGACPYAELSKIGGNSCGPDGLLKLEDSPVTAIKSISVSEDENGESAETLLAEFTVPEEIMALDGYGQGINADCCNYIDWRPEENIKKFVRKTRRRIYKGTEQWGNQDISYNTDAHMQFALHDTTIATGYSSRPAASTLFKWNSVGNVQLPSQDHEAFNFHPNRNYSDYIYVRISRDKLETQDTAGFKKYLADNYAAGTPFVVEYAISTPEETDLAEILGDDNLIPVSEGGKIVALNAEGRDIPLALTYQIKEAQE